MKSSLWDRSNLFPWCIVQYDAVNRTPEERALMLNRLGFSKFAYDWGLHQHSTFEAEIHALKKCKIDLIGWWFLFSDPDDPIVEEMLDAFGRHDVQPQLWVEQEHPNKHRGDWAEIWPEGLPVPRSFEEAFAQQLSMDERVMHELWERIAALSQTPEAQLSGAAEEREQVERETRRFKAFADLAAPYGCRICVYNHGGWLNRIENQLAVIERLHQLGVTDVGLVYNFIDARREGQEDHTGDFQAVWDRIAPYVQAVNITGMGTGSSNVINLSQGTGELDMMRVIVESGWQGPVGLYAHDHTRDAETTLQNRLRGLEWCRAELKQPGSAGPTTNIPLVGRR